MLIVGSGPTTVSVYGRGVPANGVVFWNGTSRPTSPNTSNSGWLSVALTASDLAGPSLAEVTVFDPDTGAQLADSWMPVGFSVVPVAVVYDAVRNLFYLATGPDSTDPQFPPDSIVVLNPATGAVGPSLSAGTRLGEMAISDDSSALYVILAAQGKVRRIDPRQFSVAGDFAFNPAGALADNFGNMYLGAIAVMPGEPETVAVQYIPSSASTGLGLDIFDGGVRRSNGMNPLNQADTLLFSPDGHYLFGGNRGGNYVSTLLFRYAVDSTGFPKQTPPSAPGGAPVSIVDGILYTSLAMTVDATTMRVTANLGEGLSLAVDRANQRILTTWLQTSYASYSSTYPEILQSFDLRTAVPLGSQSIGSVTNDAANSSQNTRLFRFGVDGVLYSSRTNLLVFHTPLAAPAPATEAGAVVNAASFLPGAVAPGEIVSIFGTNLGPQPARTFGVDQSGTVIPPGGGVQVWFNRLPGTVLYASSSQINVIAPFELEPGSTVDLQVWDMGIPSPQVPLPVVAAAPALFTSDGSGKGQVVLINQDGSIDTPSPPGSVVALYGTGGGPTGASVDGFVAWNADSFVGTMTASVGGQNAKVTYAGAAPYLLNGAIQVNVQIPGNAASGSVLPIELQIDGQTSLQEATIAIR